MRRARPQVWQVIEMLVFTSEGRNLSVSRVSTGTPVLSHTAALEMSHNGGDPLSLVPNVCAGEVASTSLHWNVMGHVSCSAS